MAGLDEYWDYLSVNYPILLGPVGVLLCHEIAYFGSFLPYWLADYIPAARKYKLQSNEANDGFKLWRCLTWVLFLHFLVEFPMIALSHPLLNLLGIRRTSPLPAWSSIGWMCLASFVIEDFYFYWIHRFLHWKKIYKYVHKVHHLHNAPFGIAAEYAHPIETLFLGLGTCLGPIIFSYTHGMHMFTLYTWLIVRVIQTVEVHSGYNFPWSMNNWMPFWGGAKFHDYHHQTFNSNYSSTFIIWDNVFGTTDGYYAFIQKRDKQEDKLD